MLLDTNVKPQVSSSHVTIAGYCMVHADTASQSEAFVAVTYKRRIFESIVGFCTSNSAHTRCMAQYFVRLMFEDASFRPFIPSGIELLMQYFDSTKVQQRISKKYAVEVAQFAALVQDSTSY